MDRSNTIFIRFFTIVLSVLRLITFAQAKTDLPTHRIPPRVSAACAGKSTEFCCPQVIFGIIREEALSLASQQATGELRLWQGAHRVPPFREYPTIIDSMLYEWDHLSRSRDRYKAFDIQPILSGVNQPEAFKFTCDFDVDRLQSIDNLGLDEGLPDTRTIEFLAWMVNNFYFTTTSHTTIWCHRGQVVQIEPDGSSARCEYPPPKTVTQLHVKVIDAEGSRQKAETSAGSGRSMCFDMDLYPAPSTGKY